MLSYISAKDAAEKWNISQRRVAILCSEKRIEGAIMLGNMWLIPSTAKKPLDKRIHLPEKDADTILKPFVKWVGGKSQLVDTIEKLIPSNYNTITKYAEPMVGGGAMLFNVINKFNFKELYISDSNAELINAYQVIKADVDNLILKLNEMQLNFLPMDENGRKFFYYAIREKFNTNILSKDNATEKASQFIFLNKTCFNGLYRVNKKGQFNVPMGTYKNPTICDDKNLRNIHTALQKITIVCGDYTLSKSFIDNNTFVYLDPPYRPISETSGFTAYNSDAFNDNEQIRLAEFINQINATGAKIVLSNSDPKNTNSEDNFFDDLYNHFKIDRIKANRAINSKADKRGKINELLIHN